MFAPLQLQVTHDPQSACRSHRRSGFSLTELLIVLAVLVSAAAIALPNLYRKAGPEFRLRRTANQVAEQLRIARQFALDQAEPVCTVYDPKNYVLRTVLLRKPESSLASIGLAADYVLTSDGSVARGSECRVVFHEDGSADSARWRISDSYASLMISIDRLSGNITLGDAP